MLSNKNIGGLRVVTARRPAKGAEKHPASTMPKWWPLP